MLSPPLKDFKIAVCRVGGSSWDSGVPIPLLSAYFQVVSYPISSFLSPSRLTSFLLLFLALWPMPFIQSEVFAMFPKKHVVLLGASVGNAWKIEALLDRLSRNGSLGLTSKAISQEVSNKYRFEYVGDYQFDKSKSLKKILERRANKPDAIFLKECAAYFPGDLSKHKVLMTNWIQQCKNAGMVPIPTTVVPIIRDGSLVSRGKDLIKGIIGKTTGSSHLVSILEYNDWIRTLENNKGQIILDLEEALRVSPENRSLRPDLHSGDGLHLNAKAYEILDKIVIPVLERAMPR